MGVNYNDANYSPSLSGYSGVKPFRFWCQKVLPLVYDDSLSYYELLNKVVDYLNKTIEDVANVEDNVDALNDSYNQLQTHVNEALVTFRDYINNYFDNLDVQEEIDAKLDEMASSGELWNLIQPYASQEIPGLVTSWLSKNVDPVGSAVVVDSSLTIEGAAADAKATGDAINTVKTDFNNFRFNVDNSYKTLSVNWYSGFVDTSGSIQKSQNYHYTNKIRLYPAQCIKVTNFRGATTVALLCAYNIDGTFASVVARGTVARDVRSISWQNKNTYPVDVTVTSDIDQDTTIYTTPINNTNTNLTYNLLTGFITEDGVFNQDHKQPFANVITTPCYIEKGTRIVVKSKGGTNTAQIMECDALGNVTSVLKMNTNAVLTTNMVINKNTFVMFGGNIVASELEIYAYPSIVNPCGFNNFNLVMPTVAFVFDDGTVGDENVYNIFNSHNKKASFALISSITNTDRAKEYLKYQNDGFEILSHSTDARTMSGYSGADITDEAVALTCMIDSKHTLMDYGFDIHGWVTPSGRLKPAWVEDVKKYYDYGFVLTNQSYNDSSVVPYFERNISAFQTYRISLQNTTPEMCRQAVDLAIANHGMVVFYGHNVQETSSDYLTTESLDNLLTYLDSKTDDLQVLPCNSAMRYFFKVTHEDVIG